MPLSVNICKLELENETVDNCIIIGNDKNQRSAMLHCLLNRSADRFFNITVDENDSSSEIDKKINTVKYRQDTLHELNQKKLIPNDLNLKCIFILDNVNLQEIHFKTIENCQNVQIIILTSYQNDVEGLVKSEIQYSHIIAFNEKNRENKNKIFNALFKNYIENFNMFDKIISGITEDMKSGLVVKTSHDFINAKLDDKIYWCEV